MKQYNHIFFDLDRTLWDFEKNAVETLQEIYHSNQLYAKGIEKFEDFHSTYKEINKMLWSAYRKDEIKKEFLRTERFKMSLQRFHIHDELLANKIGDEYIYLSPQKTSLFPYSIELLEYLYPKYKLYIITNGFQEVQYIKLQRSKLDKYFSKVFISEEIGVKKPNPKIFHYALQDTEADSGNSIMIGDDLAVDILGAKNVGMDQIYFNPNRIKHSETLTHEVSSLDEIMTIL